MIVPVLTAAGFYSDLTSPAPAAQGVAGGTAGHDGNRNFVAAMLGGSAEVAATLASDTFTPVSGEYVLDTEGAAAADNLATIGQTGLPDGALLLIRTANAARDITVKNATGPTGQIFTKDGADLLLDDPSQSVLLQRRGIAWYERARDYGSNKTAATAWLNAASTSAAGTVELATNAETITGTDATRGVTPAGLAALLADGGDLNNGATVTFGDGGSFNLITSVVTITAFNFTTSKIGRKVTVRFNTIRAITHHATNLIIVPGMASIAATAVGDECEVEDLGSGKSRINWYTKANGTALVASVPTVPCFSAHKNGTDQTGIITATLTKITLTTEAYDVGSAYDAANSKWTPATGKHQMTVAVNIGAVGANGLYNVLLYKNGSAFKQADFMQPAAGTSQTAQLTFIVDGNGSDYFEVYASGAGTGNKTVFGSTNYTWWQAVKIA